MSRRIVQSGKYKYLRGIFNCRRYRAVLEEKLSMNEVKKNCKKYIPKLIMKKHGPFPKKYVHQVLPAMCAKNYDSK